MAYATLADVAAVLLVDEDKLPVGTEILLDLATGIIAAEFAMTADADPVGTEVRAVCAEMVARVVRNPLGVSQETVGGYSVAFETGYPDDLLFLTDEERRRLSPWGGSGVGTVKTPSAVVVELEGA